MQYTSARVTHTEQKTNNFKFSKRFDGGSGLLEKIHFVQWWVSETLQEKTKNINVVRLGTLYAVFPRLGIQSISFTHNQCAKKFGELFNMPAPSRQSIHKWEKELENMKILNIPKHLASRAKTRVFTEEFFNFARKGLEKLSYISVPVTYHCPYGDKQATHTQKDPKNIETKKRAHARVDNINIKEVQPATHEPTVCAESQNIKFSRPPKNHNRVPKKLNKFENSIMWWLFQSRTLQNYREGVILFARFLKMWRHDSVCKKMREDWKDCRDASRPGMVRDLIVYLRSVEENSPEGEGPEGGGRRNDNAVPPLQIVDPGAFDIPGEKTTVKSPESKALLATCLWGKPYRGKLPHVVAHFKRAGDEEKDQILLQLMDGKVDQVLLTMMGKSSPEVMG